VTGLNYVLKFIKISSIINIKLIDFAVGYTSTAVNAEMHSYRLGN